MNLLAVDTSSNACSVAMQVGEATLERHVVEPRAHTRVLMPMIAAVLDEGGLRVQDLDAIVLGNGPGSFIGMRIGASVVQGLCYAADIPVVPVSSLLAIAVEGFERCSAARVVVAQDARMNEIYLGCYERNADGIPAQCGEESIVAVGELPAAMAPYAAAGAAWGRYPELIAANCQSIVEQLAITVPRAACLLPVARHELSAGRSCAAEAIAPAYLRTKVAEKPSG